MKALLVLLLIALAPAVRAGEAATLMDEAFRAAQVASTSQAGSALRQIGARAAARDDALAELLRDRQSLEDRYRRVQLALTEPEADRVDLAGQGDALAAEIAALDARITEADPDFAALTRPQALGIAEVQAALGPDEAMIVVFSGDRLLQVWAVSSSKAGWNSLQLDRATVDEAVRRLRVTLDPTAPARAAVALDGAEVSPGAGSAFPRVLSAELYRLMLEPLEPVFGAAGHVFVVADGPLTSLPFALLVTEAPLGDDADPGALRDTAWMIRDHALTTLPSVEALQLVRGLPPLPEDRAPFLGFGDPVLAGGGSLAALSRGTGVMASGMADVGQLRSLPPLPQTRVELNRIAKTLGADQGDVRLGAEATETAVKEGQLDRARVIAFATHGLLSGELRGLNEPALVLTPPDVPTRRDDGLLTASEIADLRLAADWVVLSACNTAGGEGQGAEGLSGLARAFLFAGARSILVSHWPVRDDAAARLTTDTFAALAAGSARGKAEALQQAMIALMQDGRDPSLSHPSAWAPFVLVGEGG